VWRPRSWVPGVRNSCRCSHAILHGVRGEPVGLGWRLSFVLSVVIPLVRAITFGAGPDGGRRRVCKHCLRSGLQTETGSTLLMLPWSSQVACG